MRVSCALLIATVTLLSSFDETSATTDRFLRTQQATDTTNAGVEDEERASGGLKNLLNLAKLKKGTNDFAKADLDKMLANPAVKLEMFGRWHKYSTNKLLAKLDMSKTDNIPYAGMLLEYLNTYRVGPEQRRKYSSRLAAGSGGVVVLLLVLESSRSLCRTPAETVKLLIQMHRTLCTTLVQYAARGFKPKFPKWTLRFELVRGVMHDAASMFGDRIVDATQAPVFRWHSELFGSFMGWFALRQHGWSLAPVHFNGLEHLWLKSSSAASKTDVHERVVVLFYHGGGYAVLSPRMYIPFCCNLLSAIKHELTSQSSGEGVDVDVFIANYHKLPEHPYPAPAEDAVAVYEYLLQHEKLQPSQIILVGDSAGGGLVLSTLLRVKATGKPNLPLPLAAIVACPLADLTGDDDKNKAPYCVLSPSIIDASIDAYRPSGKDPRAWEDASPVHCDLRGLPPVLLQTASFDYLFDHSVRLAAKAKADGVTNWEIDIHEGVTHVFMVFPDYVLPYARVGIQNMAAFAVKQFVGSPRTARNARDRGERAPSVAA
ncbi:hypothetical protein PHYPSEUDO_005906 [Phytophthora pseudosyringae]|uniref:Alpha/beta hydrolase fold-3 domain-containing protein n=1 Tax=Phytophthora pseudosyringae TaxID=221518 RepID=A0A8T1WHM6_9STRA|nr:hypothetical protein PHYPSEUDO_005906 [Phytophthora pseudosyringae]